MEALVCVGQGLAVIALGQPQLAVAMEEVPRVDPQRKAVLRSRVAHNLLDLLEVHLGLVKLAQCHQTVRQVQ